MASMGLEQRIAQLVRESPRTPRFEYRYGTAGFREKAEVLDSVCLRMGMLSWLRARTTGSAVGLMVTASHNPVEDNGLKAVDPDGGMLVQAWEKVATDLVNAEDSEVARKVMAIAADMQVDLSGDASEGTKVFVGRDTRPHSLKLASLALAGIEALGGKSVDIGVVTTPQLHHCVRSSNIKEERHLADVAGYNTKLTEAYKELLGSSYPRSPVIVDGAYGVGAPMFKQLYDVVLNRVHEKCLLAEVRNSPVEAEPERLNNGVGAEHVQKSLQFPENTVRQPEERGMRFASFDGDADRIVYYRATKDEGKLNLFDGDKIACLFTFFIQRQLKALPVALTERVQLACIQTAYANGASSKFIRESLGVDAPLTKTGVKHLHHKALEYDIGVYFEANGHGTVLFRPSFIASIKASMEDLEDAKAYKAARNICELEQLINQATGDAMADLLAVEAILAVEGMSLDDWDSFYSDLPSRQLKCKVADRTAIKTNRDESRVLQPTALQDAIDLAVSKYSDGRAFARPSGTEDAVRVYAEASTVEEADQLALEVNQAIYDHAGGVGQRPS